MISIPNCILMVIALISTVTLTGCINKTTTYTPYYGEATRTGTGGTMKNVDGIEIWENGSPNKNYEILGIIDDQRVKASIPMSSYYRDLTQKATEVGGNAIIILGSRVENAGIINSPVYGTSTYNASTGTSNFNTYGSSSVQKRELLTKAQVIRYLD